MSAKLPVPKFITIEDKLAGLVTFKQLFALLGAFFFSYIFFKINTFLGVIMAIFSFFLAFLLTFVYINGKPILNILPSMINFFFQRKRFVWQRIEKQELKEVEIPSIDKNEAPIPQITSRIKKIKTRITSPYEIEKESDQLTKTFEEFSSKKNLLKEIFSLKNKNSSFEKQPEEEKKETLLQEEKFLLGTEDKFSPEIEKDKVIVEIKYPELKSDYTEKVAISLDKPIADQVEQLKDLKHHHLVNPKNPYRFFPYVKFFRLLKEKN